MTERYALARRTLRAVDRLNLFVFHLMGVLMAAMCVFALLQVSVRLLLTALGVNLSVPWSEEIGRYLMIWLIFLGAAYACRHAQMIALNFVIDRLPRLAQRIANITIAALCAYFFLMLIKVGWELMQFGWIERSPVMRIPTAYLYLAMPVGATLMVVNTFTLLIERGALSPRHELSMTRDETPTARNNRS